MKQDNASAHGFTLVEILVVVAILGVLMGLVALLIPKAGKQQKVFLTEGRVQALQNGIENYKREKVGRTKEWPPMTLESLGKVSKYFEGLTFTTPNDVNESSEALFLALRHPDLSVKLDPNQLAGDKPAGNTDEDAYNHAPPGAGSETGAMELLDAWGNPIVYIEKNSYGKSVRIMLNDGTTVEVQAKKRPDGNYYNENSYQLISLGANEVWDDPSNAGYDDLTNFVVPEN